MAVADRWGGGEGTLETCPSPIGISTETLTARNGIK